MKVVLTNHRLPRLRPRKRSILALLALVALSASTVRAATFTVTTLNDDGAGSLREAIAQANANPGLDTITFAVQGTIVLASTLPAVTDGAGLTIDGGQAVTISGNHAVRVLRVEAGAALTVQRLTIADGKATDCPASVLIGCGGGILNSGTLTVQHSTFAGNAGIEGGGIASNRGTLRVSHSTFSGNSAHSGGGINNYLFPASVSNSTFSGNTAGQGGGIYNYSNPFAVSTSTFSGNTGAGSAIFNRVNNGRPEAVTVSDSTLVGNVDSTVAGASVLAGVHTVSNSILFGYCTSGDVTDGGGNISHPSQTCPGMNVDPQLDPQGLRDNGGPTRTIALRPTSPAIDTAATCPPSSTDQRGEPRPQDGNGDGVAGCDIGAYEYPRLFTFTGFLNPIDNLPTVNAIKAGRAVPVTFSLGGYQGMSILAANSPSSQQVVCDSGAPVSNVEQTATAGGSSLSYDTATDTYTYVWKTEKNWAGTCRQLVVRLADGSFHVASFRLK